MNKPRILFWHRKDLRIFDNQALIKAFSLSNAITSTYIFDKNYSHDFNASSRAWFLGNSLQELGNNWKKMGSRLIMEEGDPVLIIPQLAKKIDAKFVFQFKDIDNKLKENKTINSSDSVLEKFIKNIKFPGSNICPCRPGENAAETLLENFINEKKIYSYNSARDFPSHNGTSFLSASLRFGTISIRKIWNATLNLNSDFANQGNYLSIETWQKELVWREFYQHCLFHFPELEKGPYRKKWDHFPWQNNNEWFQHWSNGETGVPIVDAAMRQLNSTGWMHNRCRMIVASFLVKDLICNWQMGEKKFMETLVDGDLAANNGGWQWSASSGMDPKPLRIFNPYTQAKKFDPICEYIKYWIPELSKVSNSELLNGEISNLEKNNYSSPIVNHNIQQRLFKSLYAEI